MDPRRPVNANVLTYLSFAALCGILLYNFVLSCHLIMVTHKLLIYSEIILMEGMLFAAAYYLKSLDLIGACTIITGHILSIIPIRTKLNILSAITMTVFMTLFPVFQYYISTLLTARLLLYDENGLPFVGAVHVPQTLHLIMTITYIIHHYLFHCNHRSSEDLIIGVVVFRVAQLAPNIPAPELILMVPTTIIWMFMKAVRFEPLSTFPLRSVGSLNW